MKIYSFKETDENKYKKWNGKVSYDCPIVKQCKRSIINILKENKLATQHIDLRNLILNFKMAITFSKDRFLDALHDVQTYQAHLNVLCLNARTITTPLDSIYACLAFDIL